MRETTEFPLDDESSHLVLRLTCFLVDDRRLREDSEYFSDATIRNPNLRTVQDIMFAIR